MSHNLYVSVRVEKSPSRKAKAGGMSGAVHTTYQSLSPNVRKLSQINEKTDSFSTQKQADTSTHTQPIWSSTVSFLGDVLLSFYKDESCC